MCQLEDQVALVRYGDLNLPQLGPIKTNRQPSDEELLILR